MPEKCHTIHHSNHNVYLKEQNNGSCIIFVLYLDEILIAGSNMKDINVLKGNLANSFTAKNLDATK